MNMYKLIKKLQETFDEVEELNNIAEVQLKNEYSAGWCKEKKETDAALKYIKPLMEMVEEYALEEVGDHYYQMHNNRICIFRTNKGRVVYSMYSDKAAANIRLENDHYKLGQRCIWRHCDLQATPQEYAKPDERWCGFYDVLCGNDEKITMILYGESSTYPITIENYDLLVDFAHQLQKDNEFGKIERLVVQSLDNKEEFLTLNI